MIAQLVNDFRLARRNLSRNRRRSSFAFLTVVGGIVAYMLAAGFIDWIFLAMRESTIYGQLGHFQISRQGYVEKGIADPYRYLVDPNAPALDRIRHTAGVESLAPRVALAGLISLGDSTAGFLGEGIDPALEKSSGDYLIIQEGAALPNAAAPGVLLGEGLAKSVGAKTGDKVVLLVKTVAGGNNAGEYVVSGIFSTSNKAYDDAFLRLPIKTAQTLIGAKGANVFVGFLSRTEMTDRYTAAFAPGLTREGLRILPWSAQADFYLKTVSLFSKQVGVVKLIIAIIIILSIMNTLTMAVLERTQEIGTSLALGVRRMGILRLFVIESALIGAFGGAFGIALGAAAGYLISTVGIPMPPPPGMAHGFIGQIRFSWSIALDALALAVLTTLIAGALPAWRASRVNIVDSLRQTH